MGINENIILNGDRLRFATFKNSSVIYQFIDLIVLGFNDTSIFVGHFKSSPREREKRDRRDSRGDEREGRGRKRKMNESEDTDEIEHSPSTHTCCKDSRPCPTVSQYQLDALVTQDTRTFVSSNHPLSVYRKHILYVTYITGGNKQMHLWPVC